MRASGRAFAYLVTLIFLLSGCVSPTVTGPPLLGAGDVPLGGLPPLDPFEATAVATSVGMTVNLAAFAGGLLTLPAAGAGPVSVGPVGAADLAALQVVTLAKPLGWEEENRDYPVMRYGDEVVVTGLDGRRLVRVDGRDDVLAVPVEIVDGVARLALDVLAGGGAAAAGAATSDRWVVSHVYNLSGSLVVPSQPIALASALDGAYLTLASAGGIVVDALPSFDAYWIPKPAAMANVKLDLAGSAAAPPSPTGEGVPAAPEAQVELKSWFGTYLRFATDPTRGSTVVQGNHPADGWRWTMERANGTGRFRFGDVVTFDYRAIALDGPEGELQLAGHRDGRLAMQPRALANGTERWTLVNPLDRASRDAVRLTDSVALRNEATGFYLNAESDKERVSARARVPYEYETWRLFSPIEEDRPKGEHLRGGSSMRLLTHFGRFLALGTGENATLVDVDDGSPMSTDFFVWRVGQPTFTGPLRYGDRVMVARSLGAFIGMDPVNRSLELGLHNWRDVLWTLAHPSDLSSAAVIGAGDRVMLKGENGFAAFAAQRDANHFDVGGVRNEDASAYETYSVGVVEDGVASGVPDATGAIRARDDVVLSTGYGLAQWTALTTDVPHAATAARDDPQSGFFIRLRADPDHGGALWTGDHVVIQDGLGRYLTMAGNRIEFTATDAGGDSTFAINIAGGPRETRVPIKPGLGIVIEKPSRGLAIHVEAGATKLTTTSNRASVRWTLEAPALAPADPPTTGQVRYGDPVKLRATGTTRYLEALDRASDFGVKRDGTRESPWSTFVLVDEKGTTHRKNVNNGQVVFLRTMHGRFVETAYCGVTLAGCTTKDGLTRASIPSPGRNPESFDENRIVRFRLDGAGEVTYGSTIRILDDHDSKAFGGHGEAKPLGTFVIEGVPASERGATISPGALVAFETEGRGALRVAAGGVSHVPGTRDAFRLEAAVNVDPRAPFRYGDRVDILDAKGARLVGAPGGAKAVDSVSIVPDGWRLYSRDFPGSGYVRDGDVVNLRSPDGGRIDGVSIRLLAGAVPQQALHYGDTVRVMNDNGFGLVATDTFQSYKVVAEGAGTHSWENWILEPVGAASADGVLRLRDPIALKSRHGTYLSAQAPASAPTSHNTQGAKVDAATTTPYAWTLVDPENPASVRPVKPGDRFQIRTSPEPQGAWLLRGFWDSHHKGRFGTVDARMDGVGSFYERWSFLPPMGLESNAKPVQMRNVIVLEHLGGGNLSRAAGGAVTLKSAQGIDEQWVPILRSEPGNRARLFFEDVIGIAPEAGSTWLGADTADKSKLNWKLDGTGPQGRVSWVVENPWGTALMPVESGGEAMFRLVEQDSDGTSFQRTRYLHESLRADPGHPVQTRWKVIDLGRPGTVPLVSGEGVVLVNDREGAFIASGQRFTKDKGSALSFAIVSAHAPSSLLFLEYGDRVHLRSTGASETYLSADATLRKGTPRAEETWIVVDPVHWSPSAPLWSKSRVALLNVATGNYLGASDQRLVPWLDEAATRSTWWVMATHEAAIPELDRSKATAKATSLIELDGFSSKQPLVSTPGGGERPWFLHVSACGSAPCPPARMIPYDAAPGENGAARPYRVDLPPPPILLYPPLDGSEVPLVTPPTAIIPVPDVDCRGLMGIGAGRWDPATCRDFILFIEPSSGRFMLNGPAREGPLVDTLGAITGTKGALLPFRPHIRFEPFSVIFDWISYAVGWRADMPSVVGTALGVYQIYTMEFEAAPSLELMNTKMGLEEAVPLRRIGAYLGYDRETGRADIVNLDRVTVYESILFTGSLASVLTFYVPWWAYGGALVGKAALLYVAQGVYENSLTKTMKSAAATKKAESVFRWVKLAINFFPLGSHWAVDGVAYGLPLQQGYSAPRVSTVDIGAGWEQFVPFEHQGSQYVLSRKGSLMSVHRVTITGAASTSLSVGFERGWDKVRDVTVFSDRVGDLYLVGSDGETARVASVDLVGRKVSTFTTIPLKTQGKLVPLSSWTHGVGYFAERHTNSVQIHAIALEPRTP